MKKHILLLLCIINAYTSAKACGACGCSMGGILVGVMPQYNQPTIGVRYQFRSFTSNDHQGFENKKTYESYHSMEFFLRLMPSKKTQIIMIAPFNYYIQKDNRKSYKTKGIGDPTFIVNYEIWKQDTPNKKVKHLLLGGIGLKIPIGNSRKIYIPGDYNVNLQNGSGSTDFIFLAQYTMRHKSLGWYNEFSYRSNGTNKLQYKLSDKLVVYSSLFYAIERKKISILPQAGIRFEHSQKDHYHQAIINHSGGMSLCISPAFQLMARKWTWGIFPDFPVFQNVSNGISVLNVRFNTQLFFNF